MATEEIIYTKAILVEGNDEVNFFGALFKHLKTDDVHVFNMNGTDIKRNLPAFLKRPGISKIISYAIIVDADNSHDNKFISITNLLKQNEQPAPKNAGEYEKNGQKQVGIFIMPGNLDNGMLEDLCLKTVDNHPAIVYLNQYFASLKEVLPEKPINEIKDPKKFYFPKNLSKSKALGFLAALHEPFSSVGVAAQNGYWDFEHDSLQELKDFLTDL